MSRRRKLSTADVSGQRIYTCIDGEVNANDDVSSDLFKWRGVNIMISVFRDFNQFHIFSAKNLFLKTKPLLCTIGFN
jgi:hypothetical protein